MDTAIPMDCDCCAAICPMTPNDPGVLWFHLVPICPMTPNDPSVLWFHSVPICPMTTNDPSVFWVHFIPICPMTTNDPSVLWFCLVPICYIRMAIDLWLCTHGDFIMLPHWATRPPAHDLISHSGTLSWHCPCFILLMLSTRLGGDKYQSESYWCDSTRG